MSKNKIISLFGLIVAALYGFETLRTPEAGANFVSGTKVFPLMIIIGTVIFSIVRECNIICVKESTTRD